MKSGAVAFALVAISFAVSGCGSAHPTSVASSLNRLPNSLRAYVNSSIATQKQLGNKLDSVEIYGPATHTALEQAAFGGFVTERCCVEEPKSFYLLVLRGRFANPPISTPLGATVPSGTIETDVWSPEEGSTDDGRGRRLPATVAQLPKLSTITVS